MAYGICNMFWLKKMIKELKKPIDQSMKLYRDKKATNK